MPIVLYSDFKPQVSFQVDDKLLSLLAGSHCRVAYIPSDSDLTRRYFQKVQQSYQKIGISEVNYFDLGLEFDKLATAEILKHDAIHLSGGEPVKFLEHMKARQFGPVLKSYLKSGGILIGVSAGAMILTPSLELVQEIDEESVPKSLRRALGILEFEIYPHYKHDKSTAEKLARYAVARKKVVYAFDDDAGIIINENTTDLVSVGVVQKFQPSVGPRGDGV